MPAHLPADPGCAHLFYGVDRLRCYARGWGLHDGNSGAFRDAIDF